MIVFALAAAAAASPAPPKPVHFTRTAPAPAAAAPADAVAATERAFARRAQSDGQWRAFRAFAAPDAVMFVPNVKPLAEALSTAREPSVPVMWWPATIVMSCDGSVAVSTGPWVLAATAGKGSFTTVWRKTANGYRWQLDHGRGTPQLIAAGNVPRVVTPSCTASAADPEVRSNAYEKLAASVAASAGAEGASAFAAVAVPDVLVQAEGVMPVRTPAALPPAKFGAALASGHADDWTLAWASRALLGGAAGAHDLRVWQWRGRDGWKLVMYETIGLK